MPYKKKRYRRKRRRRTRPARSKVGYSLTRNVAYQRSPVPNKFKTTLKYSTEVQLNPGVLAPAVFVLRGNDLYDPEAGVGGHQPRGFDELISMYDHFVVLGSKITATFSPTANNSSPNLRICLSPQDTSTSLSTMNDYLESGSAKFLAMTNAKNGQAPRSLTMQAGTGKFLGRTSVLSDPQLKGSVSSSPQEQFYWHVGAQGYQSEDAAAVDVQIQMEYIVIFLEPKTPGQS